jgi:hypothetical protein
MDLKQAKDYIKENLKIEEVIGNYVKLKKSGKNFNAPCPFHAFLFSLKLKLLNVLVVENKAI